jgi:hypothetical protein
MKKCKECNREYEDPQTVGDFFEICDECYKEEYKKIEYNKYIMPLLAENHLSTIEQMMKVTEEQAEFIGAVAKFEAESGTNEEKEHIIEEFFDMIQASLGLLDKMGLINLLEEGRIKHIAKLIERGWEFKKML